MADPTDLEEVRALFTRVGDDLIEQYRAHGAGVGREGELYVIVVYLGSQDDHPAGRVRLEGVPLKFEVTGPFTTLPH